MRPAQLLIMGLLFGATPTQGATQEELLSMSLDELVSLDVSIATGTPKSLRTTPGATSIITAAELESMGAQDIDEALEMVPGLHVSHSSFIYASRYFIRGIVSTYNPHTLLLVNGIPQTSLFTGDRGERMVAMTGLPVSMIERIEIIRGPGSAVYGADAFAGVINIITRKAGNAPRGQATVSHGSFDTGRASVMQNAALGPVQALLSLAVGKSEGDNPVIASDLPVFREVGGTVPTFLAPDAAEDWLRMIKDFMADGAERNRRALDMMMSLAVKVRCGAFGRQPRVEDNCRTARFCGEEVGNEMDS